MTDDRNRIAQCLFSPRSVAIVGASADPTKHASLAQQHLRRHGFAGDIYPINSRRTDVLGERAYPSLRAVGKSIDHVFVNVSTGGVQDAVEDCVAIGAACVTILSDGFAEQGADGIRRQTALIETARKGGLRVLGPNSIGLVNVAGHVALSANEVLSLDHLTAGGCGVISQSGSLMGALLSRGQARQTGFSKVISVGNEGDLGVAELGELLIDDEETSVILLLMETIRRPANFAAMARRAFHQRKPIVAFRLGASPAGAELAASHTGALAGDGKAMDAFLQDCGIICVRNFETLIEMPPLLAGRRPPQGKRIATVTTTGGGASLVVDHLGPDVAVTGPSAETIARLAARGVTIGSGKIIDLTLAGTNAQTYGAVLQELHAAPDYDLVLAVVGSSSQFRPDRAVAPIVAVKTGTEKPMAVFLAPQADESLRLLRQADLAAFRTPEACADAINSYLGWKAPRPLPDEPDDLADVRKLLSKAGDGSLDAAQALAVFGALGVEMTRPAMISTVAAQAGDEIPGGLTFPVAVKILSPDIQHKTEAGGVVLNVRNADELREACRRVLANARAHRPDARLTGVQVEPMEAGLAEAIIGYRTDPCVGPVVVIGAGGVLTELYQDVAIRTAPVDLATAYAMIEEVRGFAPLRGFRGMPQGDLDALARALVAVSKLAWLNAPAITEAEINPVLVRPKGQGVVAVDAVMICSAPAAASGN